MIHHIVSEHHIKGGVGRYIRLLEETDPAGHSVVITGGKAVNQELIRMLNDGRKIWIHSLFESFLDFDFSGCTEISICMHAPVLTCVGGERFLQSSELQCNRSLSRTGCFVSALSEKCCSRHPKTFLTKFSVLEKLTDPSLELQFIAFSTYTYGNFIEQHPTLRSRTQRLSLFGQDMMGLARGLSQEKRNGFQLLYVGRIIRHKGVHLMMQAWIDLQAEGVASNLMVIGSDPHAGYHEFFGLEKQIQNDSAIRDRYKRISWAAPKDLAEAMVSSDLLVVPSIYPEAFGLVGVEALSLGLPALAFNVGGVSEWCVHGKTGMLLSDISVKSLRIALKEIIGNPCLLETLSSACRQSYESKFTAERHMLAIENMMSDEC